MSANFPRLCGGTFFCLLIRAVKNHARSDVTHSHGYDGYSQRELLRGLLKVLYLGDFYRADTTLDSEATRFKHCENIYPIEKCDVNTLIAFDWEVQDGGFKAIKLVSDVVEHFFDDPLSEDNNNAKKELFVKSILQLIREDETIRDDQEFFVCTRGTELKKSDLLTTVDFCFERFLLGIWHYCIKEVHDNEVGKATYREWFPNGDQVFTSSIGQIQRKVRFVPLYDTSKEVKHKKKPITQGNLLNPSDESLYYKPYFEAITRSIGKVNTILRAEAYDFDDFYVTTGLGFSGSRFVEGAELDLYDPVLLIPEPNLEKINEFSSCLMIQATGGMGKSMLMRHLMFNGIKSCIVDGRVPVFISLKDYRSSNYDIARFVYDEIKASFPELDKAKFEEDLSRDKYILLLDGLDEINPSYRGQFLSRLYSFLSVHRDIQTVMSTRPFSEDVPTNMFRVMSLCPLTKEQAVELIRKVEYMPNIPNLKEDFIKALEDSLYQAYRSFAKNPLLLTFMLIKFCEDGRLTENKTDFYEEVFDVLATRHDSKKVGYRRRLESGLSHERLKDVFSAFCAETYRKSELSFLKSQLISYFEKIIARLRTEEERQTSPEKLLADFVSGVCMLYKDGERYYFVHRSFQEFFCARCFKKQKPEKLKEIGKFFESQKVNPNDMAFDFLYEMIPEHVEEYILIPFLEEMFSSCEAGNGYWSYLERFYPEYTYEYMDFGPRGKTTSYIMSGSFLLNYMLVKNDIVQRAPVGDFLRFREFVKEEYMLMKENGEDIPVPKEEVRQIYADLGRLDEFEKNPPAVSGYEVCIPLDKLYERRAEYPELIALFENDEFRYKVEYEGLKELLNNMQARKTYHADDLVEII